MKIMEAYIKTPKLIYDLGLTPNEFFVLMHLLRVQDYREYKGEIEDGWFAKSQNELAKECGFGSHNTLAKILQGMSKNDIVQIRPTKAVTYFKITMSKNDIRQKMTMANNDIPTMSNNDIGGMSKNDYLHKNSKKNNKQEYSINPEITKDTSTSTNNNIEHNEKTYLEKEKEEYDVTCNTSNQVEEEITSKRVKDILDSFKEGDNTRFPTMDELRAIFIKENINFKDDDFKNNSSGKLNGKYKLSPRNAVGSVNKYIRKPIIDYGFWYDSNNKDIQNAVISYINKKKLNVVIGNNY